MAFGIFRQSRYTKISTAIIAVKIRIISNIVMYILESFIPEPTFAIWNTVRGVFAEISMNLFAIPKAIQSIVNSEVIKTCLLKNKDMERVSIIIAVLNINVKGVSHMYENNAVIEFLLRVSMKIFVNTEIINNTVTGVENIFLINFFINFFLINKVV